jgi:hypothetical protein
MQDLYAALGVARTGRISGAPIATRPAAPIPMQAVRQRNSRANLPDWSYPDRHDPPDLWNGPPHPPARAPAQRQNGTSMKLSSLPQRVRRKIGRDDPAAIKPREAGPDRVHS